MKLNMKLNLITIHENYVKMNYRTGLTDRYTLRLENVGQIECVQFRIGGTDGWHLASVFQ